jgi:hypothetical protein
MVGCSAAAQLSQSFVGKGSYMHRRLLAVTFAVGLLLLVRTSTCNAQEETLTSEGYTIAVPDDWEVIEEEKTIFTVRAPRDNENDSFSENIRVVRHTVGKAYSVSDVLRRQKSDTGRFKLIGEGTVDDAEVPMVWMAITPKSPRDEGDVLVKIDFITTKGTDIVVLTAMAEPGAWKTYLPQFKKIVSTFAPLLGDEP